MAPSVSINSVRLNGLRAKLALAAADAVPMSRAA